MAPQLFQNWPGLLHAIVRFCQLILALAVVGLYAQDLHKAHRKGTYSDGKWVYATVVGSMASITALLYVIIILVASSAAVALLFGWDLILFVLWTALFGIFGGMYINTKVEMEPGIQRMKNAVWVDLANMLLWFLTAVWGVGYFFFGRQRRGTSMGRTKSSRGR